MRFRIINITMRYFDLFENNFRDLLNPKSKSIMIGNEKGNYNPNGISRFDSQHGSVRYIMSLDGIQIGVLQLLKLDKTTVRVANVFVEEKYRRRGIASLLFKQAKKDFKNVVQSDDLSDNGQAWADSLAQQ